jgi:hypothetical protein
VLRIKFAEVPKTETAIPWHRGPIQRAVQNIHGYPWPADGCGGLASDGIHAQPRPDDGREGEGQAAPDASGDPLADEALRLMGGGIWQLDRRAPGGPTDFFNVDFDFEHLRSGGKRQGPGQTLPAKISRINPRGQRRSGTFGAK